MKMRDSLFCVLAGSLLAACSAPAPRAATKADAEVDQQILEAARQIQAAQTHLYHAGAFNRQTSKAAVSIDDNAQRVTLTWNGDASQLLARLAKDRGLKFKQMGVRLPLPVVIEVKDEPFSEVLDQIRAQVGYRAVVDEPRGSLVLFYQQPKS